MRRDRIVKRGGGVRASRKQYHIIQALDEI